MKANLKLVSSKEGMGDYALRPSGLSPYGSQAKPAAAIARGHRTYLDPNPRLVHHRGTIWRHDLDMQSMLDEDAVRVEADKRRQAIRAEQAKAKEGAA